MLPAAETYAPIKAEKCLVSVIVPVFNAAGYLKACVDSVLAQSYGRFELWLVDDGSTDASRELCLEYGGRDPRVKAIRQDNSGVSAARNAGLKAAGGDFILFLDADDSLGPDSLSKLVAEAGRTGAELVVGNSWLLSAGGRRKGCRLEEDGLLGKKELARYLLDYLRASQKVDSMFTCWGKLFRASVIRRESLGFIPEASCYEDTVFVFHYLRHSSSIAYLSEPLYNYLAKDSSLAFNMSGRPGNIFGFFESLPLMEEYLRGEADPEEIAALAGNAYVTLTIIKMVHLCRNLSGETARDIYAAIGEAVSNPLLRRGLPFYEPGSGGSRLLPVLMKYKLVRLAAAVCRYKAYCRFGGKNGQ